MMSSLLHFTAEELKNIARPRNVDVYQNMSIFTTLSASIPTPIPISRPRPRPRPRLRSRSKTCNPNSLHPKTNT